MNNHVPLVDQSFDVMNFMQFRHFFPKLQYFDCVENLQNYDRNYDCYGLKSNGNSPKCKKSIVVSLYSIVANIGDNIKEL